MSDADEWHTIIAKIKDWVVSERLSEEDRPTPLAAMDAIRWCRAHDDEESPDVAAPSGDGCVAIELHDADIRMVEMLEFDGSGEMVRTRYERGKVIAKSRVPIVAAGGGE